MVSISIGHIQVLKGFENDKEQWLSLASWTLDYSYRLNKKWALVWQNEVILSDFEVESVGDKTTIIRSTPVSSLLAVSYFPVKYLSVFIAAGGEFAKEDNLVLLRTGTEFSYELNEYFELLTTAEFDYTVDGYDSFGITFGVGYKF